MRTHFVEVVGSWWLLFGHFHNNCLLSQWGIFTNVPHPKPWLLCICSLPLFHMIMDGVLHVSHPPPPTHIPVSMWYGRLLCSQTGLIQIGEEILFIEPVDENDPSQLFSGLRHRLLRQRRSAKNSSSSETDQPSYCGTVQGKRHRYGVMVVPTSRFPSGNTLASGTDSFLMVFLKSTWPNIYIGLFTY